MRHNRAYKRVKWGFWCAVPFCGVAAVLFGANRLFVPMGAFVVVGIWCFLTACIMALEDG